MAALGSRVAKTWSGPVACRFECGVSAERVAEITRLTSRSLPFRVAGVRGRASWSWSERLPTHCPVAWSSGAVQLGARGVRALASFVVPAGRSETKQRSRARLSMLLDRPAREKKGEKFTPWGKYPLPREYEELLVTEEQDQFWSAQKAALRSRLKDLRPELETWQLRVAKLHESLWLEEVAIARELLKWQFETDAISSPSSGRFKLDVSQFDVEAPTLKGLLKGVVVKIKSASGAVYEAHLVEGSSYSSFVEVSAKKSLASAAGPFSVKFRPQRFQHMAMHRALDSAAADILQSVTTAARLPGLNETLADRLPAWLGGMQRRTIAAVVTSALSPIVLWGPPGSGKSTVLARAVWTLLQEKPNQVRVLVAGPSNMAADVICLKLAKLGVLPEQMLRLNALGRHPDTLPEGLLRFSHLEPSGGEKFGVPGIENLRNLSVIVATCSSAAHIVNALRKKDTLHGWFSHVIVDEAGEATEPETLIPLSLLKPVVGCAVLAGDHFQLGPHVTSMLAAHTGKLEQSMLERIANERLAESGLDTPEALEEHGIFFLTQSFRSHADIMSLYSKVFYKNQLVHLSRVEHLGLEPFFAKRSLRAPVLLHNIRGKERRASDSFSICNMDEVKVVMLYLQELLGDAALGLKPSDIGVIAPYRKQVEAIEKRINAMGASFSGIDVGTVENFQGQERRIVIISTVRSLGVAKDKVEEAEEEDGEARSVIGFVSSGKRLNVAISRAVAGLVVVGDLATLVSHSSKWREFVRLARESGATQGQHLDMLDMALL